MFSAAAPGPLRPASARPSTHRPLSEAEGEGYCFPSLPVLANSIGEMRRFVKDRFFVSALDYAGQTTVTVLLVKDKAPVPNIQLAATDKNGNYKPTCTLKIEYGRNGGNT